MRAPILIAAAVFLAGCGKQPPAIVDIETAPKPIITYQAPMKQALAPFRWDFPRMATHSTIKNSAACIENAKKNGMSRNGVYLNADLDVLPGKCAVPAVDVGSNLYIGVTEVNFRSLVTNYDILLTREKRWLLLLEHINRMNRISNKEAEAPDSTPHKTLE